MTASTASNWHHPGILDRFGIAARICLATVFLLAATVLSGWLVPGVAPLLPDGWLLMQSSTALGLLFLAAGFTLAHSKGHVRSILASRACALAALVLAGMALYQQGSGQDLHIAGLPITPSLAPMVRGMSVQSASCLALLGLSLFFRSTRQDLPGRVLDGLILMLVVLDMVFIAGYVFDATQLLGDATAVQLSPQTLFCIMLLTFVATSDRAPYGFFSALVSVGIGSQIARMMLPASIVIAYLVVFGGEYLLASGKLGLPYVAAITASGVSAVMLVVIIVLARRINGLESELRHLSLTDELTGIHNRRGFYLLGEQALHEARRNKIPFLLLFFDVDGLKKVNDTQGHDAGSRLILDVASLLRNTFRDRDILGRVGGDEFAVIAWINDTDISSVLSRLNDSVEALNKAGSRSYPVSFSAGEVRFDPGKDNSLDDLMVRADMAMYLNKRDRRTRREVNSAAP